MFIQNKETLFLTAIFILPGFISTAIVRKANPLGKSQIARYLLECLAFSIVNIVIFAWAYYFIFLIHNKWLFLIIVVLVLLISSVFIGLLSAYIIQNGLVDKCMKKFKIKPINSTPSSWDYFFSKGKVCFIIVTMKNGAMIAGYYGEKSFASSSMDERDIYIEKGFYIDENGKWIEDDESEGFYVNSKDIEYIEFRHVDAKEDKNEQ